MMTDAIGRFTECLTHVLYDLRDAVADDSIADEPALDWQPAGDGNETRVAFIPPTGTEQLADKARVKLNALYYAAIVEADSKFAPLLQEGRAAAEEYIEAAVMAAEAKRPAPADDAFLRLNHATVELVRLWNALPKDKAASADGADGTAASDPAASGKAGDDQRSADNADDLDVETKAIAILAKCPKLKSIEEVAKLAGCSRQYLANKTKCPRFAAVWKVSRSQNQGKVARGSKSKAGDLEAWE